MNDFFFNAGCLENQNINEKWSPEILISDSTGQEIVNSNRFVVSLQQTEQLDHVLFLANGCHGLYSDTFFPECQSLKIQTWKH